MSLKSLIKLCFLFTFLWNDIAAAHPHNDLFKLSAHYTNTNGLPQNTIKSIVIDDYGFVWLATEVGLARFDGINFRLFDKFDNIPFSRTLNFFKDDDRLYVVDESWLILEIKSGFLHSVDWDKDKRSEIIFNATFQELNFGFWASKDYFNKQNVAAFFLNEDLSIHITTDSISWVDNKNRIISKKQTFVGNKNNWFFVDKESLYCVEMNHTGQILKLEPNGNSTLTFKGDLEGSLINQDVMLINNPGNGQNFLIVNSHLYYLQIDTNDVIHTQLLLSDYNFDLYNVRSILYDEHHSLLYIGSYVNGLSVFSLKQFSTLTIQNENIKNNIFYDIVPFSDYELISGSGYILNYTNGHTYLPTQLSKFELNNLNVLVKTSQKNYLFGATNTVLRFDEYLNYIDSIPNFEVDYMIASKEDEVVWATGSSNNPGLYRLNVNNQKKMTIAQIDSGHYGFALLQDGDTLWCATNHYLKAINIKTGEKTIVAPIDNATIRLIKKDKDGGLWLGTFEDGLFYYNNGKLTQLPMDNKKRLKSINAIQEDNQGNFWISTNNGLFQTAREDLLEYVNDNRENILYLRYTQEQGFNNNEFNGRGKRTSVKLPNGYVAFSSLNGIVYFHPDSINTVFPQYPIILDKVTIDGDEMESKSGIGLQFPSEYNRIIFQLATSNIGNEESILYEYKLNDGNWVKLSSDYAEFNELPHGNNTISFRKLSNFGESYNYLNVPFRVEPHWWETVYFWLGIATISVFVIWLFAKVRNYSLNKRNLELMLNVEERTQVLNFKNTQLQLSQDELKNQLEAQVRINETITHDIKTPLKYMAIFIRKIKENTLKNHQPKVEELDTLLSSVNNIYNFTNSVTLSIKSMVKDKSISQVNIYDIISEKIKLFQNAANEREITFVNKIKSEFSVESKAYVINTIIHNLIDNAIKNNNNSDIVFAIQEIDMAPAFVIKSKNKLDALSIEKYNHYFASDMEDPYLKIGIGFKSIRNLTSQISARIHINTDMDYLKIFLIFSYS